MWAQLTSVEEKWKVVSDRKLVLCSQARNKGGPRDVTPICKDDPTRPSVIYGYCVFKTLSLSATWGCLCPSGRYQRVSAKESLPSVSFQATYKIGLRNQ